MLERLVGHEYYYFLDGFSGYFQIPIAPEDHEKTTFTCPYRTFVYKRMPFGCNAPATFQRRMTAIFHELIEDSMEEKCHFMVKEGIILGHKVSSMGIEVDKAKIEAISKLPYPTNIKAIRSLLGHACFYRRFIKDFSQVARPMTQLLAPIMIKPDWLLPFEVMCDASDYADGALLGQRIDKHFKLIHYANKTMNEAQENYTTTEKELLAVVFAFDKFRQYLVLSKTIIFTDHSALRVRTESYEGASPEIRQHKSFGNVTADHLEDIMVSLQLQEKSLKPVSTGHISSATHAGWSKFAMHVNEPATSPRGTKHLKRTSKSAKYSMFGE
ncbi:reverse transcriptase domain-containing protein [Tanacetum coccineum]